MRSGSLALGLLSVSLAGCSRPLEARGTGAARSSGPAPSVVSSSEVPPSASSAPATLLPIALSGCAAGADPALAAAPLLRDVGARCVHGMTPLVGEAAVSSGPSVSLSFSIADPSRCVQVSAAGDRGVQALRLRIEDDQKRMVEQADAKGRVALLGPQGPTCLDRAGAYRVTATVAAGTGEVALMAWQAE